MRSAVTLAIGEVESVMLHDMLSAPPVTGSCVVDNTALAITGLADTGMGVPTSVNTANGVVNKEIAPTHCLKPMLSLPFIRESTAAIGRACK
jgi:hypothetical protein